MQRNHDTFPEPPSPDDKVAALLAQFLGSPPPPTSGEGSDPVTALFQQAAEALEQTLQEVRLQYQNKMHRAISMMAASLQCCPSYDDAQREYHRSLLVALLASACPTPDPDTGERRKLHTPEELLKMGLDKDS